MASWAWQSDAPGKFTPYSKADAAKLEKMFKSKAKKKIVKLNATYDADLIQMIQYRRDDPDRQRPIRRTVAGQKRKDGDDDDRGGGGGGAGAAGAAAAAAAASSAPATKASAKKAKTTAVKAPPRNAKRLQSDLKLAMAEAAKTNMYSVELIDDDLSRWEFQVHEFDPQSQIAKDLQRYNKKHGVKSLTLRMYFPDDYPIVAPFVHVYTPKLYGGYVFQGGLCASVLMQGWAALIRPAALLLQIRQLLQEGNARILNHNKVEYWDESEARKGFSMAENAHRNDKNFAD